MSLKHLLALAPLAARLVSAHGWVNSWVIDDGEPRDGFVPSDVNRFPVSAERPTDNPDHGYVVPDDPIVACGGASPGQNRETWEIKGGSKIRVNWISDDRLEPNMVWPREHKGAIMEYMAECPTGDCNGVDAWDLDWFKISEQGVDGPGPHWATDQLNETRIWEFTIPENVKPGAYLVRHELNAMHNRTDGVTRLQVYPVCIQTQVVSSSGQGVPDTTVKFPDAYQDYSQDFATLDVWAAEQKGDQIDYTPPGPRVATLSDGGGGCSSPSGSSGGSSGSAASSAEAPAGTAGSGNGASGTVANDDIAATSAAGDATAPVQTGGSNSGSGNDDINTDVGSGSGSGGAATSKANSAANPNSPAPSSAGYSTGGRSGYRGGHRTGWRGRGASQTGAASA